MTRLKPSTAALDEILARLRRGYALRMFLEALTFALAADFSLDILAQLSSYSLGWTFHVPFFFEMILGILIAREAMRLRKVPFFLFLDRSFNLKDRIYSFHTLGMASSKVPVDIRESQASECLEGVDFSNIRSHLKPRVPPLLLILAPVFLWIVYSSLNTDYIPRGTVSRTAVKLISPETWDANEGSASVSPSPGRQGEKSRSSDEPGAAEDTDTPQPLQSEERAEETEAANTTSTPTGHGEDAKEAGGDGKIGNEPGNQTEKPNGPIESQAVTEKVTPLGEDEDRSGTFTYPEQLADPTHLLNLLPVPEQDSLPGMKSLIIKMGGKEMENFPVRYHAHIYRYYEELLRWQKDQTTLSPRN